VSFSGYADNVLRMVDTLISYIQESTDLFMFDLHFPDIVIPNHLWFQTFTRSPHCWMLFPRKVHYLALN